MTLEQIYEKIEDGSLTVDEINNMDLMTFKGSDTTHISDRIAYFDTYQMALKIAMNSLYGALANTYFLLFNRDVAASITGNGRIFIQGLATYINEKLRKVLNTKADFVVYGDTDSCLGDTIIYSKTSGMVKIEQYFDHIDGKIEERDPNNFIKHIYEEDETYSVSPEGKLRTNKVNYVMKHQVRKRMFKITVEGKSVTVTEDHSVIVKRDGEIMEVKPNDIKKSDFLIRLVK